MSKRNRPFQQWHGNPPQQIRNGLPFQDVKTGAIMCPFCTPSHPLSPGISPCGTTVAAIQTVYRNVTCAMCGKNDGILMKVGKQYIHTHPCSPGKIFLAVPPKPSKSAAFVWKLPKWCILIAQRLSGKMVMEITSDGVPTHYGWQPINRRPRNAKN